MGISTWTTNNPFSDVFELFPVLYRQLPLSFQTSMIVTHFNLMFFYITWLCLKDKVVEWKCYSKNVPEENSFLLPYIVTQYSSLKKLSQERGRKFKWYAEGLVSSFVEESGLKFAYLSFLPLISYILLAILEFWIVWIISGMSKNSSNVSLRVIVQ